MNKNIRLVVIILVVAIILYFVVKMSKKPTTPNGEFVDPDNTGGSDTGGRFGAKVTSLTTGQCITPPFKDMDLSGRTCAGNLINENKTLRLGDQSCEVLLLQQRLNAMQTDQYILKPTGQFCCKTKFKLNLLMGIPEISLNRFSPDEQIGFNELEGGKKMTPYSYMDLNTKIK